MENKCAVIDIDSLIFSAFHPNKVLDEKGEPLKRDNKYVYVDKTLEEIMYSCDYLMGKLLRDSKATEYIAYVKGKNTTKDRILINPNYKDNRGKIPPKFWNFTKEYLKLKWNIIEVDNAEVDDYVNFTRLNLPNSFICAIDKDLLQLEGTHFNWRKSEWVTTSKNESEYSFWADFIIGQPGDNIEGLKGKGEKFVEKLFCNPDIITEEINYSMIILKLYIEEFGEEQGIINFYKNYSCLKIKNKLNFEFEIPKPILVSNSVEV